ncbi:MAG TPA: lipocalin family protein, partial [Myxococcaceae bacterium]|nr:lipocalin family protein [Myxococcaceae bacterium]
GTAALPARLRAAQAGVEIDLEVAAGKPPVLQGNRGLSQKSAEAGNASYYYSLTRMPTAGQVRIGNEVFAVQGESWMDREWSTSALGSDQVGWDWFSLQLSDGTELMYYQLRKADGTRDPFSRATWVDASDRSLTLDPQQIRLQILSNWQSPHSQVRYPSGWLLTVPTQELELTVTPLLKDQELNLAVRYWEGAVRVEGTRGGKPVQGNGYVELTGYGDERGAGPQRH